MHMRLCVCVHRSVCDWGMRASAHESVCVCARACTCIRESEGGGWVGVGARVWLWAPVTPVPSPHSYVENQEQLQHLDATHLRGLGELRDL